ncbi:MAG: branched-chain-amino-acid transaminase [Phycisphaerae bacterium]|nr:branched-chain-amino-acid transaminase [Phycisphaerae bacterium]NIP55297.1 branched-chain-amino-acid transaminase [Phycisphaerae bacterium]NIS53970.1 branched-chain-amino-acid transaminase [Phycisphaerae bacterium]NIU11578.1 branched-chain-amino-acid transaminase [Phycisphaerae bacterium]NIU59370.1 branched-chain-amino-acid transaminase [Phycisphaerae bacterium]
MGLKIWLDKKLVDETDARISVFDHGLLYGDGVFEGIRVYNSRVFELEAHIKRLYESAKAIRLEVAMSKDKLIRAVEKTTEANGVIDGYIRLVVTRGVGTLGLNPFICEEGRLIIIADNIQLYPEELYETGMKVISATTVRNHPLSIPPQVKSLNYLNNILAKIEALDNDVPEAVMYNHEGYVAEATGDNVFIVKNGVVYTPPVEAGSLEGITRSVVIKLAEEEKLEVVEKNLTRFDLYNSDEFFLTGTAAEVIGVVDIDSRIIGAGKPGPITRLLRKKFYRYAHGKK